MKKYKVKYIIRTSSRCGYYDYKYTDTFEAENEIEAERKCREHAKTTANFKRFIVLVLSVTEIN